MTREKELQLQEKYPKILKNLYSKQSCMAFGIEHGDGWYDLIDRLCHFLQWHTDKNGYGQVVADQIKEKFGELRFYYHIETSDDKPEQYMSMGESMRSDAYLEGAISFAEVMSGTICDVCGKPGTLNNRGWIACRCEEHK